MSIWSKVKQPFTEEGRQAARNATKQKNHDEWVAKQAQYRKDAEYETITPKMDWGKALDNAGGATGVFKGVGASAVVGGVIGGGVDAAMGNDSNILDGIAKGAVGGAILGSAGMAHKAYKVGTMTQRFRTKAAMEADVKRSAEEAVDQGRRQSEALDRNRGTADMSRRRMSVENHMQNGGINPPNPKATDPLDAYLTGPGTHNLSLVPNTPPTPGSGMQGIDYNLTPAIQRMINTSAAAKAQRQGFGY